MPLHFPKGTRMKDPVYLRLRSVHNSMKQRCYNPNTLAFQWYGAKGVTVCKEWQCIEGFIETIDTVEGFDLELFSKGVLELDKDAKYSGNKLYSPETCKFVLRSENAQYKPSYQRATIGLSPKDKVYEFTNHTQFAEKHGLLSSGIRDCLSNRCKLYKGWLFIYKSDDRDIRELKKSLKHIMVAESPLGDIYEFTNKSDFARRHGFTRKGIERAINLGKAYKGWLFYNKN